MDIPIDTESAFPSEPVEPRVFIEDVIPALFVDLDLTPAERAIELRLGVVLRGESGGEWTLHFVDGELGIEPSRSPDCDLTLVQRVVDWRAALWSGEPAFVADAVQALFRPPGTAPIPVLVPFTLVPNPRALEQLRRLRGLLEIRVDGGEDWCLGIRLGPGPIPVTPDAVIQLGAAQAEAIHRGSLHPLEALMTGELRLEGDLGLILQIQAIAMTASLAR